MDTKIYTVGHSGGLPHVVVYGKRYLFIGSHEVEIVSGYDGLVFPYLCTYIFADNNRQPIATIMIRSHEEPELMDTDWNGKNRRPIITPFFSRQIPLNIPQGFDMRDVSLEMLRSCRQAHQLWSASVSEAQPFFDNIRRSVTLFDKTYFISRGSDVTRRTSNIVLYDLLEGFIFINEQATPDFALTKCAGETYFTSAAYVDNRVVSMFCLDDSDVHKLGGELLYDFHRSKVAERLYSILALEMGVAE